MLAVPTVDGSHHSWPGDFPDPDVVWTGSDYVAVSTASAGVNIPVLRSADLGGWRRHPDALPSLPAWSEPGRTWAPALRRNGAAWLLYYTTRERASGQQVISVALGTAASGPFADASAGPLIAQRERGGSIDPSPYSGYDGSAYLCWKSDDNARGMPSTLWSARLSDDGLHVLGDAVPLLRQDRRWQHPTVEAPSMLPMGDGRYLLLYSAGAWSRESYAMGYAVCDSAQGPCRNVSRRRPWLAGGDVLAGPGGAGAFRDRNGAWRLALHAWSPGLVGYPQGARSLWIVALPPLAERPPG